MTQKSNHFWKKFMSPTAVLLRIVALSQPKINVPLSTSSSALSRILFRYWGRDFPCSARDLPIGKSISRWINEFWSQTSQNLLKFDQLQSIYRIEAFVDILRRFLSCSGFHTQRCYDSTISCPKTRWENHSKICMRVKNLCTYLQKEDINQIT